MAKIEDVNVPKPGEVSTVNKQEPEQKKSLAQELIEDQKEAIRLKATSAALGIPLGSGEEGGGQQPSIQSQIVTNAMNAQNKLIENMDAKTEKMEAKVEEANESVSTMRFALLQDQMVQLKETQKEAIAAVKEAQAAGAPKDAFGYYSQVSGELAKLVEKIKPAKEAATATSQQPAMSEATQVRLKELELKQQQVLAQITADNTRAREQFQLQMLEFTDNKEIRHLEYQDKTRFRQEGIQGVNDLVAALGAGVSQKGGPGSNPGSTVNEQASEGKEAEADAYISSFKCGVCAADIPVESGQTVVKCPGCGAGFSIKAKE